MSMWLILTITGDTPIKNRGYSYKQKNVNNGLKYLKKAFFVDMYKQSVC